MESFNFGNLVGGLMGAVVKVAVAEAREDGELSDEQAEELFEEKFKALLGASILAFGSGSSGVESDEEEDYLDFPVQVTDGAAVTYDKNGGPSEQKSVWDCVLGVKDYFSNGASQGISNVKDEWEKVKDKHIILGAGLSGAASNGVRAELSESFQFDLSLSGFDWDILYTDGGGVGSSFLGGGAFVQASVADNGISDLLGDGKNTGTSIGPISADYATADHAKTYSYNIGKGGIGIKLPIEIHTSDTKTYSLKESVNEFKNEVEYEYNKWEQEIIQQG